MAVGLSIAETAICRMQNIRHPWLRVKPLGFRMLVDGIERIRCSETAVLA